MSPGATFTHFLNTSRDGGDSTAFLGSLFQFLELGRQFWFLSDHPFSEIHVIHVVQWSVGSYSQGLETKYKMYKAAECLITFELLSN